MKKIMNWVLAATLVCGASVFTACSDGNSDNPNQEQAKKNRTEFIQHTRQNLKNLALNMNFSSWNAANTLNQRFNQYVLNNPEFEQAVLKTFLWEALKTVKYVEEGSELAEMGFTTYGTIDLTNFNYRFVMTEDNTGFDIEEGDEFEVIINAWDPQTKQIVNGAFKLTLKAGGNESYKFVVSTKQMEGVAFVVNVPSEFQFVIADKMGGTWNEGFSGSFVNQIAIAEGHEFVKANLISSWGVSGVLNSNLPAALGQKADQTSLSFSLLSDRANHKVNTAVSWAHNGLNVFDLSMKTSGKGIGGLANLDLSQATMSASLFDMIAVLLNGCSVDEAKLTILDDLTTITSISDMGKVTKLSQQLAEARRSYADLKTIDQYTQQMNELVKSQMTCKGLNQNIPMKMKTIQFGVDYWTVPALNFSDENGYVAITDMLDKESIEYMLNIIDHGVEPMQQSLIVVRQLIQYVTNLASGFQIEEEGEE